MIYLDTHIIVWLYAAETERLSSTARHHINADEPYISPMVVLELQYLYETGRTTTPGDIVVRELSPRMGLRVCEEPFPHIVSIASSLTWTRDPFDRIIVGHAALRHQVLVTKDSNIREHYPHAVW